MRKLVARQVLAATAGFFLSFGAVVNAAGTEPVHLAKPGPATALLDVSMTRESVYERMRPRSMFEGPPTDTQFRLGIVKDVTFVCYSQKAVQYHAPYVQCDAYKGDFNSVQAKPGAVKIAHIEGHEVLVEFNGEKKLVFLEPQVPQQLKLDSMHIFLKLSAIF